MGGVLSISRNFPATGSEGLAKGVRLNNSALLRRMPWGDNWQQVRIGIMCNLEVYGSTRDNTQPMNGLFMGVTSGPWSVGDPRGRTWRAFGMNVLKINSAANAWDFGYAWDQTSVGGQSVWGHVSSRGGCYYISATSGSYATGGIASTRAHGTFTAMSNGGQFGFPDSTGTPRRTAIFVDIFRNPYGTVWSFRSFGALGTSPCLALDMPLKSYLVSLAQQQTAANNLDGWYALPLPTPGTTTASVVTPDTRNSPMDYVDLYWDSLTMGLDVWRFDVRKIS